MRSAVRRIVARFAITTTITTVLAACGGDGSVAPGSSAGIFVVRGGGTSDTVGTVLVQALTVEVYSAPGRRAPKETVVRFTALDGGMAVGPLTGSASSGLTTAQLDGDARASVLVRMGFKAGPARIEVSVPTLGLVDTISYTVLAGKAARIAITPVDTLVYFDASYTVTGTVTDVYSNPRSDPVAWSTAAGSPVSVSSAGVVKPNAPGRYSITATAGTITSTAIVRALPRLRLVAYRYDPAPPAIISQDLDGSNLRVLTSPFETGIAQYPAWIPGTSLVAYSSPTNGVQLLRVVDESNITVNRVFISAPPATMTAQVHPTPSANGAWMFFSALDTRCGNAQASCVFRSAIDGSSPELLAAGYPSDQPAPSPDGSKVAFTRLVFPATIRVLDIASGTISSWSVQGQHPRWAPDGSKIAFLAGDGLIKVINADGTNMRELTQPPLGYEVPAWSPDSKFIVVRRAFPGWVDLIDVASATAIQLPKTETLQMPQVK